MNTKILRVNMSDLSHKWEDVPSEYQTLGNRTINLKQKIKKDDLVVFFPPLGGG